MRLSDVSINRPVFAVMLVGALVALGMISISYLGVDLFPRVEFPMVTVTTILEGASPETVETEVTEVIESTVNTISGIDELVSDSSEGVSRVFVRFELEEDIDIKAQDVRDKVALARRDLPLDAESPIVEKLDPDAAPILAVIVSGPLSLGELTRYADDVVKERLERLPGVGSVSMVGGREREIRIWLDGYRLRGHELSADDVIRAIQSEHAELPGGRVEVRQGRAELGFKTLGEVERVEDFGDLVVAYRQGGPILLRDLARVEDGLEDERSYAEIDGQTGVSLLVRRQSGRNSVQVARLVKAELKKLEESGPPGVRLMAARDVSRFIESAIRDVTFDMSLGAALAVLVTLLFLRSLRSTLIVSVAIPTSIVATFFFFYVFGFTINMLTMMALSISIGILIDDAIVVLENIYRHVEAGEPPMQAASVATAEIGPAVVAATLAIGAVFVPIAFMRGVVGRFFFEYGLSVVIAVFMSLLVALTLTPMLCSRLLRRGVRHGVVFRRLEIGFQLLESLYRRSLAGALRHRWAVVAMAVLATIAGIQFASRVPLEFTARTDRSEFQARLELPLGTGIAETKEVIARAARQLREIEEVTMTFATIGGRVNEAQFYVRLTSKRERERTQFTIMDDARRALEAAAPEARSLSTTDIDWVSGGGYEAFTVDYDILGPNLDRLQTLSEEIARRMRESGSFVDVKTSFDAGNPEIQARVDRRRAAALGVNMRSLANTLRALIGGLKVATFEDRGERYDVRVRLEEEQRDEIAELGLLQIRAADGRLADLDNLARLRVASGPVQITRRDRSRVITVFGNAPPGVALGTATAQLQKIIAEVGLPPGYEGSSQGDSELMQESFDAIKFAFLLALLSLYMILASQFNSFIQPGVVMLTAPLAFIGAFAALWISGKGLGLFAQIGIIILMGLVMKNGILLVDFTNQLRGRGHTAREAALEASIVRLRPVLMTTVSTVSGMLPVALSRSDGAEFRNGMGVLIVGGLLSSMFLTLLVVPVVYTLIDGAAERLRRILSRRAAVSTGRPTAAEDGQA